MHFTILSGNVKSGAKIPVSNIESLLSIHFLFVLYYTRIVCLSATIILLLYGFCQLMFPPSSGII